MLTIKHLDNIVAALGTHIKDKCKENPVSVDTEPVLLQNAS